MSQFEIIMDSAFCFGETMATKEIFMKRILFAIGAAFFSAYLALSGWNLFHLRVGLHEALLLPVVQIPWTAVAYLGFALAHKGITLFILGAIGMIALFRLRRRISN